MPTRLRKIRKLRGSRTCSWGRVGQHRKSGMRGGFGRAGLHKHKWTWTVKYAPDYFGKRGFKSPIQKIKSKFKEVNVGELSQILSKMENVELQNGKPVIDLPQLGYGKLLGRGELNIPVVVKAIGFTENAIEKVKKAGGEVVEVKV
ncbi:MAG: uL15 family ribosomal protein [Candidatus Bathyarchaeia archaeon]